MLLRVELDLDAAAVLRGLERHLRAQRLLKRLLRGRIVRIGAPYRLGDRLPPALGTRRVLARQLLCLADREAAPLHLLPRGELRLRSRLQQRPRVPFADLALLQTVEDRLGQAEEAQAVRDGGLRLAHALRDLLLREAEFRLQAVVRLRGVDRADVLPL